MYLRLNLLLIVTLFLFAHGSMPRPVHDNFGEVGPAAGAGEGAGGSESLPLTDPRKNCISKLYFYIPIISDHF